MTSFLSELGIWVCIPLIVLAIVVWADFDWDNKDLLEIVGAAYVIMAFSVISMRQFLRESTRLGITGISLPNYVLPLIAIVAGGAILAVFIPHAIKNKMVSIPLICLIFCLIVVGGVSVVASV